MTGVVYTTPVFLARQPPAKPVEGEKAIALIRVKKTSFGKMGTGNATAPRTKGGHDRMDEQSLSHTKWKCQYHIVIVPKYRRKAIYGKLRQDIGMIFEEAM